MNKKKRRDDEEMQATLIPKNTKKTTIKDKLDASFAKVVKKNGKALEKLSKH